MDLFPRETSSFRIVVDGQSPFCLLLTQFVDRLLDEIPKLVTPPFHVTTLAKMAMEGPLSKWTNVVKGWQYRWFVLDEISGLLSYYTVLCNSRINILLKLPIAFRAKLPFSKLFFLKRSSSSFP